MSMQLEIVTPEEKTFSDRVDSVIVPGIEGEMGILEQHAALITTLIPGELRYTKDGEEHELAIGEGILEVTESSVSVLTDLAIYAAEIDEVAVQEALDRAQKALQEKLGTEEIATVEASIQRSLVQLQVKHKRRRV